MLNSEKWNILKHKYTYVIQKKQEKQEIII